jgi:hypothetical protein
MRRAPACHSTQSLTDIQARRALQKDAFLDAQNERSLTVKNASQLVMPPAMRGALELLARLDPIHSVLHDAHERIEDGEDDPIDGNIHEAMTAIEQAISSLSCIVGDESRDVSIKDLKPVNVEGIAALLAGEDAAETAVDSTTDENGKPIKIGAVIQTDQENIGVVTHFEKDVVVFEPFDPELGERDSHPAHQCRILRDSVGELTSVKQ